jgi:lysophospholipid acyltransferase (LPLAT)-like uncharacterized protein
MGATLRTRLRGLDFYRTGSPVPEPTIFAFWHDQLLVMITALIGRGRKYAALASQHPDAEPVARLISKLGLDVVRGSSTRGGLHALGELAGYLRKGGSAVFTPDGPRGPRHEAGEGVITLARRAGVRIVPVACAIRPRLVAGSWDRLQVPLPFAAVVVMAGSAIRVPESADAGERAKVRDRLGRALNELTGMAEKRLRER